MHYALDICLLIIIVLTVFMYCRKGLFKTLLGFGKTIISVILAFLFGKTIGELLADNFFNDKITDFVYNSLLKVYGEDSSIFDLSQIIEKMPKSILQLTELCGVSIHQIAESYSNETAATTDQLHDIAVNIAFPVSKIISDICGYLIIFIVSYLLLVLVGMLLEVVTEIPVIRFVNRTLGFLFGCICAFIYSRIFVLLAKVILICILTVGKESTITEIIDKTYIFRLFDY